MSLRVPVAQHACTPELINGRAAMVGMFVCLGSEAVGGGLTLAQQAAENAPMVAAFVALLSAASLVPVCAGRGPPATIFRTEAEVVNGRLAMASYVVCVALEYAGQNTLF